MLELTGISKRFGGTRALDDVDFDLQAGEVHVLFGENGAGKTTLINVITGNVRQDKGRYQLRGRTVSSMTPHLARDLKIAAVYQEFSLVPDLTVADNIFLGREDRRFGILRNARMRREAEAFLDQLGFDIPTTARVGDLPRARRQMVEIAKALYGQSEILILDEPTASLTDSDADKLFLIVERLKQEGLGIIYVSHRMREIRLLADRVTVLRGGSKVATVGGADVSEEGLVEMMVGRPVSDLYPAIHHRPAAPVLETESLTSADGRVCNVSIQLRAGEIVGLAGLVGCGKSEVGRLIFGVDGIASGEVRLQGKRVVRPTPRGMLRRRVCYFPADRSIEGLAPNRPIRENASAAALDLAEIGQRGWLKLKSEAAKVRAVLERLNVRPLLPEQNVVQFSGGNRQKVMLARGLMRDIDVFLFDEPTVGIDVGAKAEIYELPRDLTEAGAAVLLVSSELPEILHLSNRIYVMHDGELVGELEGERRTESDVLLLFFGKERHAEKAQAI